MVSQEYRDMGNALALLARDIGIKVRDSINSLSFQERDSRSPSILKGATSPNVDSIGEKTTIERMIDFSDRHGIEFRMVVKPERNTFETIGRGKKIVYAFIDPVDGTIKIAGLGNEAGKLRMGNDGVWGCGASFTYPTDKKLEDLKIGDFLHSALVDGNPRVYSITPDHAYTQMRDGKISSYEMLERSVIGREFGEVLKLQTSTQTNLWQAVISLDDFQAYDRNSARSDAEQHAELVRRAVRNRNEGGAFDVWHIYGTAAEILVQMISRPEIESQTVARIALNCCLGDVVPMYSVVKGAGGEVVDLQGRDIGDYHLSEGRPDLMCVANPTIKNKLLEMLGSIKRE